MKKRGAYFFVIDVFVASIIIIIALIMIFNFFLKSPETEQSRLYANDFMNFLLTTEVRDFQNSYKTELVVNKNITNTQQSLFNQIIEFHKKGEDDINRKFINNISQGIIPDIYGLSYTINKTSIYNRSINTRDRKSVV